MMMASTFYQLATSPERPVPIPAMAIRRVRGIVLRLVRRRGAAIAVGLALAAPSAWVEFSGRFDSPWQQGLALIVGATGLAILWTGLTGASPDWIDDERQG